MRLATAVLRLPLTRIAASDKHNMHTGNACGRRPPGLQRHPDAVRNARLTSS